MIYPTRALELSIRDNEHCKRLKDPQDPNIYHLETLLPFTEAVKLELGNANVRRASEHKKPFKEMTATVEDDPASFHLKNRGIIYLCEKFEFDNAHRRLRLTVPVVPPEDLEDLGNNGGARYGVADGGHTFKVIQQTVDRINELREKEGWTEPFVRVHFLAGEAIESSLEGLVEALNTSSQVQQYTLDEYGNQFDELKVALRAGGFDLDLIAFGENEVKEWDVREIIQRAACFLKDRWKTTQPTSMYKSRGKALDSYGHLESSENRAEFRKLYGVIGDIITLPEFIESEFSKGVVPGVRFGNLRAVKTLKEPYTRPGTSFVTEHQMHLAASLPLAAAFRELLELRGDRYYWKIDPKLVFHHCADDLYKALAAKSRTTKSANTLGSDVEYWTQAANIILRAKDELLARQFA